MWICVPYGQYNERKRKLRGVKTDTTKFYEVYYVLSLTSFIGPCIKIKNISKPGYLLFPTESQKTVGLTKSKVAYTKLSPLWDVLISARFVESESF